MMLQVILAGLIPVTAVTAVGLALLALIAKESSLVRRQVAITTLVVAAAFAFLPLVPRPVLDRVPTANMPPVIQPVKEFSRASIAVVPANVSAPVSNSRIQVPVRDVANWAMVLVTGLLLGRWLFGSFAAFLLRWRSRPYATSLTSVPVRLTPSLTVPASLGGLLSAILLPEDCANLEGSDLEPILLHEEAHIRNRDHLWNAVAEMLCVLHWFNPLAWLLRRTLRIESERLADDHVVLAGHSAPSYASLLLRFQGKAPKHGIGALQAIATRNSMKSRFRSILEPNTRRSLMKPKKSLILAGIAGLIAVPLAAGFLAPGSALFATPNSGQLQSGDEARRVELVQVGRNIGHAVETWDSNGNPISQKDRITHSWRPDEVDHTGVVQRYLHVVYRVEAKAGDSQPETCVGSPSKSVSYPNGIEMGFASSDYLFTRGGWHYFVDHLSVGPLQASFRDPTMPSELKDVKDLGHRYMEPTSIGIWFSGSRWTNEGSIASSPSVKSIKIEPAGQLPKGFEMEKISKVWSKLTFVADYHPTDTTTEYDAYLKDGTKLPETLLRGNFGGFEPGHPNLMDNVYYIGAPADRIDHISQRTRPGFKGDLEVPLSPNADRHRTSGINP